MFSRLPVMFGVVMVLEAILLFAGFKFLGGGSPQSASGAHVSGNSEHGEAAPPNGAEPVTTNKKNVTVRILDGRFTNNQSGRIYIYEVSIHALVKSEAEKQVTETVKDREALINDRVRTTIGKLDPAKLGGGEPGLETLRRQVKYQLDEIIGEGIIDEVLVPRCIPYRAD